MNNPLVIPMTISENATTFEMDIDTAINVSGDVDIQSLRVTENGTYQEQGKAYSPVTVNVPQPSGSISITQNGSVDVTGYATANVQVRQPSGTKQISVTQNGTQTEDVEWYEDAELTVNVPNTYTASDEGKVVNNGALVGQTSRNITTNGTVDTTLNNEVVVAVPNSYTQADEGKVVSSGALVSQTSRTVSDNGTYDTTTNNQIVVDNEDYADSLVAFGVEDDLADGIEALTTYSNEVTGESDTTLSEAVRTLVDGYGGGGDIEDGVVVTARNASGYITEVEKYGDCGPWEFGANSSGYRGYAYGYLETIILHNCTTLGIGALGSRFITTVVGLDEIVECDTSCFINGGLESMELPKVTKIGATCFRALQTTAKNVYLPVLEQITGNYAFQNSTSLETVQIGSVGHPAPMINNQPFYGCTQSTLTITAYQTGANADTLISYYRRNATNATIVIKASENTTYNGVDYSAGDTIITSTS